MTQEEKGGIFRHDAIVLVVSKGEWFPQDEEFTEEARREALRLILNGDIIVTSQPRGAEIVP